MAERVTEKAQLGGKLPVKSLIERVAQYEITTNFFPVVSEINFFFQAGSQIPLRNYLIYVTSLNGTGIGDELILDKWHPSSFPGQYVYLPPMNADVELSCAKIHFAPGISELCWGVLPWKDAALLNPLPQIEVKMNCRLRDDLDNRVKGMTIVKELDK